MHFPCLRPDVLLLGLIVGGCSGSIDLDDCPDEDGDQVAALWCGGLDCNDNDPSVSPNVKEVAADGIDNDCDQITDESDKGDDPSCGAQNEPCCDNNSCDQGLTCSAGLCRSIPSCGGSSQICCPGDACDTGFSCSNGTCASCGKQQEICCHNSACQSGLSCQLDLCEPCGADSQACCDNNQCNGDVVCSSGQCHSCGGPNQPCCAGSLCTGDLVCNAAVCAVCGGANQPCCAGNACPGQADLVCQSNVCSVWVNDCGPQYNIPPATALPGWSEVLSRTGDMTLTWKPEHSHNDNAGPLGFCPAQVENGATYLALVSARYEIDTNDSDPFSDQCQVDYQAQDPVFAQYGMCSSQGRHNIYAEIRDDANRRLAVDLEVTHTATEGIITEIAPYNPNEVGWPTNFAMWGGSFYMARATYNHPTYGKLASDAVSNMRIPCNHHVDFLLTFQVKQK